MIINQFTFATNAAHKLFDRININKLSQEEKAQGKSDVLDCKEVATAKSFKFELFNLFNLTEGMTEAEFIAEYCKVYDENVHILQQTNDIHVKYLQLKYWTKEMPKEGETIEAFEKRISINAPNVKAKLGVEVPMKQDDISYLNSFVEDYNNGDVSAKEQSKETLVIYLKTYSKEQIQKNCPDFYKLATEE